ncbi:MAG: hypothetical protein FWD73_17415 [Polyangiaceae bacterium]|nr:hypothetical protein [Polyangiaceae bacterium]
MRSSRLVLFALLMMGAAGACATPFGEAPPPGGQGDGGQSNGSQGDGGGQGDGGPTDNGAENFRFNIDSSAPLYIVQGISNSIPISIARTGATASDIQVTVQGLPSGVVAAPLTIHSAESTGNLQINVPITMAQGALSGVTIQGQAVGAQVSNTGNLPLFVRGTAGSLDATFASSGRLIDVFGEQTSAADVLVSSDDHIYVIAGCTRSGANSTCIARLTSDGVIDPAYGSRGVAALVGLSPEANGGAGVLLSDGSIVVVGMIIGAGNYGSNTYTPAYGVVPADGNRANANLAVNSLTQYGAPTSISYNNVTPAIAPLPNGEGGIIVFDAADINDKPAIGALKITSNGVDDSFGQNGVALTSFPGASSFESRGVAVRPDGTIAIVGVIPNPNVIQGMLPVIEQLTSKGSPDPNFASNGQMLFDQLGDQLSITTYNPRTDGGKAIALLAGGQVVAMFDGGNSYPSPMVAFAADGKTLDTAFGSNGVVSVPTGTILIPNVFVDNQNRLLVPSYTMGFLESVSRYTADGSLDRSFGSAGKATQPMPSGLSEYNNGSIAARVQTSGRIVLLSNAVNSSNDQNITVLSRLWN